MRNTHEKWLIFAKFCSSTQNCTFSSEKNRYGTQSICEFKEIYRAFYAMLLMYFLVLFRLSSEHCSLILRGCLKLSMGLASPGSSHSGAQPGGSTPGQGITPSLSRYGTAPSPSGAQPGGSTPGQGTTPSLSRYMGQPLLHQGRRQEALPLVRKQLLLYTGIGQPLLL